MVYYNQYIIMEAEENPDLTADTLQKIAKALGVTVGDLFK